MRKEPTECITRPRRIVMGMVRFFDKLKNSLSKNKSLPPPLEPPPTPPPASDAPASTSSDPSTALATSSPAVVVDVSPAQTPSETAPKPSSPNVVVKRRSSVKISRVRVHRATRPRPVIRERPVTPDAETAPPTSHPEAGTGHEDREQPMSTPEPVTAHEDTANPGSSLNPESTAEETEPPSSSPAPEIPEEDHDNSPASPEPMTAQEETEPPAANTRHVITRNPMVQKRLRKVRVIKPKVRVVH